MNPSRPRIRAAKACKRCSQRKIKCDAMQNGLPCSRCRMDGIDGCCLIPSRRGTYDRRTALLSRQNAEPPVTRSTQRTPPNLNTNGQPTEVAATPPVSIHESSSASELSTSTPNERQAPQDTPSSPFPPLGSEVPAQLTSHRSSNTAVPANQSISAMFEDFLNWRSERNVPKCGLILLGEPSPLTFALAEYPQDTNSLFHDANSIIRDSTNLNVVQQGIHPPHLDVIDIACLNAKGAFTLPSKPLMDSLISAYLTRFHPLYSIVNKKELEKVYREQKTPWLLLHAVCFIGATFCDSSVIHRFDLGSRIDARRDFYHKAKLFFDSGYETSKVILAQCSIMLSFWGPQTHSYWNPCSWIGFGVTFAVSLGIHRSKTSSSVTRGDKGILRRLWWTLVVRDTCCAVLLGRPFRINVSQCDTEMLTIEDFPNERIEQAFYQIQIAKLSIFLRRIVHCRFGPGNETSSPGGIHTEIQEWHSELQQSLAQWPQQRIPFTCSIALELLYNYYLLLLFIPKPAVVQQGIPFRHESEQSSDNTVEFCAQRIAAQAIHIITKTKISDLPHELFPAFFVAGIVLYRKMHQQNELASQMARANLDNCRIVLNETKEIWDPSSWALDIFNFLCTSRTSRQENPSRRPETQERQSETAVNNNSHPMNDYLPDKEQASNQPQQDSLGFDWSASNMAFSGGMDDYFLMPNFLPPTMEEWSGFPI